MEALGDPLWRRRVWRLVILSSALLLIAVGALAGQRMLAKWVHRKTIRSATTALAANDYRSALLAARQALSVRPNDVESLRIIVRVAQVAASPEVILWQKRLSDALGNPPEELLTLAGYALQYNETFLAGETLARIPPESRDTVAFHELAAVLTAKDGQIDAAASHLKFILERQPENIDRRFDLASVQLLSGDVADRQEARSFLEECAKMPRWRIRSLRVLAREAFQHKEHERALELAQQVAACPDAAEEDQFFVLETLQPVDSVAFREAVERLKTRSGEDPARVFDVMRWMNAHGLASESAQWYVAMPRTVQTAMPVPVAAAEAFDKSERWSNLRRLMVTSKQDEGWGSFEFIRRAYRARSTVADTNRLVSPEFQYEWDSAVQEAARGRGSLWALAGLAAGWGWSDQAAQVWWMIANQSSGQRDALKELFRHYRQRGDTANLYEVAKRRAELEQQNPVARNNRTMLALLLERDLEQAHREARELSETYPAEPGFASTYALSLLRSDRPAEAIGLVEDWSVETRRKPAFAFYYALIIAANGRTVEARPLLQEAIQTGDLLPEERAMAEPFLTLH